jgi:hypothetical protein
MTIYAWSYTDANSNANVDAECPWQEGMAAKNVNNDARGTMLRVAQFVRDIGGAISAGGTANGLTVTVGSPFTAYANGQIIAFRATSTNTGATTLNVNGIGSKAIRRTGASTDVALTAGTIVSGGIYVAQYSTAANGGSGAWVLVNPTFDALFSPLAGSTSITSIGTLVTDVNVTKSNAVVGVGATSVINGGIANYGADGTGQIGIFSTGGTIFIRPNGRTDTTSQGTISTAGLLTMPSFSGVGTLLTALNASNLGSGTVPSARVSGSYTNITAIGTQASITVTADAQDLGTIGRSTSNPWSIRWGGASGGLYVGGSTDSNFAIGTAADLSSNRAFYVDSTTTIAYGQLQAAGGFRLTGAMDVANNTSNITLWYSSSTHSDAIDYWRSFTGSNPTTTVMKMRHGTPSGSTIGSITCNNTTTAYNTTSDYRLKENVEDFAASGAMIDALRPVTFTWKSDGSGALGFIAHEVQEVFPAAVTHEKDGEEIQQLDNSKLVPILVAELKAVRARLAALEAAV